MSCGWRRPSSAENSLIYSIFEAFDAFGQKCTYKIEDLSEDKFENVIEILRKNFIDDDPLMSSKMVKNDSASMEQIEEYWRKLMKQKISIVCYQEGSSDIIAVSLLGVLTEPNFNTYKPSGESWSEIIKVRKFIKDIFFNPFEFYRVDKIMTEECFYVNRNHACEEIQAEMIKARTAMGKIFGISTFSGFLSSLSFQKIAADCGYEENFSMNFSKLPKYVCEGYFPGIKEEAIKIMSIKFY